MGREVKRVALDFDWPLHKTYEGYLMPDTLVPSSCPTCDGTGVTPPAKLLSEQWYGSLYPNAGFDPVAYGSEPVTPETPGVREGIRRKITFDGRGDGSTYAYYTGYGRLSEERAVRQEAERMCAIWNASWSHHLNQEDVDALVEANRLHDFTHDWVQGTGWVEKNPKVRPTREQVNRWSLFGLGHDSINQGVCLRARCEREGIDYECPTCKGHGELYRDETHREAYENWTGEGPPNGDGYQMWETTSEGSPISPVFATPEELAHWLADTGASAFGGQSATYEQWLNMIGVGWAPSAVASGGEVKSGVEAVSD